MDIKLYDRRFFTDLFALRNVLSEADGEPAEKDVLRLEHYLAMPCWDAYRDIFLCFESDMLVGWTGFLTLHEANFAILFHVVGGVHPEWRNQGIGTALLEAVIGEIGSRYPDRKRQAQVTVNSAYPERIQFVQRRGFQPVRYFWLMRYEGEAPQSVEPPAGYTVRASRQHLEVEALIDLYNDCFAQHFGYIPTTKKDVEYLFSNPYSTPDMQLVAEYNGELVGFVNFSVKPGGGFVDSLGVRPAHRRTGLGSYLLSLAIERLLCLGQTSVELSLDGQNEDALRLYRRAGFKVKKETVVHRMEVSPR